MKAILKREKGQSMVETALVLPFLIVIIIGIIDFGWLFFNKLTIANCAREGARYAATVYYELPSEDRQAKFEEAVENKLVATSIPSGSVITVSNPNVPTPPNTETGYVTVTVQCDVPLLTPMFGMFFEDNKCPMESSVTMYVEVY